MPGTDLVVPITVLQDPRNRPDFNDRVFGSLHAADGVDVRQQRRVIFAAGLVVDIRRITQHVVEFVTMEYRTGPGAGLLAAIQQVDQTLPAGNKLAFLAIRNQVSTPECIRLQTKLAGLDDGSEDAARITLRELRRAAEGRQGNARILSPLRCFGRALWISGRKAFSMAGKFCGSFCCNDLLVMVHLVLCSL